jgi:nucleoside diphosphate kinase
MNENRAIARRIITRFEARGKDLTSTERNQIIKEEIHEFFGNLSDVDFLQKRIDVANEARKILAERARAA